MFFKNATALLNRAIQAVSSALFQLLPGIVGDGRLRRSSPVYLNGKVIFRTCDYGKLTRVRARSFESKEPETLRWISHFNGKSRLLDVGANVGLFTLHAASRGNEVVSVEPDALNFALLNQNLRLNHDIVHNRIRAYCVALHSQAKISTLNVSSGEWGAALSSFDNDVDFRGLAFAPKYRQGSIGMPLDHFLRGISFLPTHIKIDVDGNEGDVLAGAAETLRKSELFSILIELDERRPDYRDCLGIMESAGFVLTHKTPTDFRQKGTFASSCNHIYCRPGQDC